MEALVREEIARGGPVTFARFMELALYAPGTGYYARPDRRIGRHGDFYTSVSVGPTFGFLLAVQFATWARAAGWERWDLVEAGAHDGRLTDDILTALADFEPELGGRVRCRIIEPFPARMAVQRDRLARWGEQIAWQAGWGTTGEGSPSLTDPRLPAAGSGGSPTAAVPGASGMNRPAPFAICHSPFARSPGPVRGVIVANELLDAFPIHRLAWDAHSRVWFEWGVGVENDRLTWCRMEPDPVLLPVHLAPLEAVLPDGFVVEVSPGAEAWWRQAAGALEQGWLVAFDYGFDEEAAVSPARRNGTARAYFQHRVSDDLLARPGDQDLTAHVDFGRLMRAGEETGLRTETWLPQGRWLGQLAAEIVRAGGPASDWLVAHARQLQTLTHPVHLGQAFRVLVQSRGVVVSTPP